MALYPAVTAAVLTLYRAVFMRSFVADGNFKAIHHKQPNDNLDVHLSHGEAFMTNDERYKAHLETAEETKMVCILHPIFSNLQVIYFM